MDKEGNFVIAYTQASRVYAQRFNEDGNTMGENFRVSSAEIEQQDSRIAMDGQGNFLITFSTEQYYYNGHGSLYNSEGENIKQLDDLTCDRRIAMWPNGDFIVSAANVWANEVSLSAYKYDLDGNQIYSRLVSTSKPGGDPVIGNSSVALNDNGFVVVWEDYDNIGSLSVEIYAKRFTRDGNAIGNEVRVNTESELEQILPDVAMDSKGNFVVTWLKWNHYMADVYTKRFNENGDEVGGEFKVNDYSFYPFITGGPRIAMNDSKYFVVTWDGEGVGDDKGIYAKKFPFYNPADINKDGYVNLEDLVILNRNWLKDGPE